MERTEKRYYRNDVRFDKINYIQAAKRNIRKGIEQVMESYVFDNAFHCGETINENIFIQEIYEQIIKKKAGYNE